MWMMTTIGFFSIVQKKRGELCIRARRRLDLVKFRRMFPSASTIERTAMNDYRYRCVMAKDIFEAEFHKLAQLVDYDNFKNAVKKVNPAREQLYHKVWSTLLPIEKEEHVGVQEEERTRS